MKFLAFRDELGEETDFFGLILLSRRHNLVWLVGTNGYRVTCLEFLLIDRIPVEEEIRDGTVVLRKIVDQSRELRVSQAVVAQPRLDKRMNKEVQDLLT